MRPPRRTGSALDQAEAAFKAATSKPAEAAPAQAKSVPEGKELVSLRLDRAVLEYFQDDGPGWQDRINATLRLAANLD